jgi:hypothetical protein
LSGVRNKGDKLGDPSGSVVNLQRGATRRDGIELDQRFASRRHTIAAFRPVLAALANHVQMTTYTIPVP